MVKNVNSVDIQKDVLPEGLADGYDIPETDIEVKTIIPNPDYPATFYIEYTKPKYADQKS